MTRLQFKEYVKCDYNSIKQSQNYNMPVHFSDIFSFYKLAQANDGKHQSKKNSNYTKPVRNVIPSQMYTNQLKHILIDCRKPHHGLFWTYGLHIKTGNKNSKEGK